MYQEVTINLLIQGKPHFARKNKKQENERLSALHEAVGVYTTHTLAAVSNYLTDLIVPYTEWGFAVGSWETLYVNHGMNQRRDLGSI